MADAEEVATVMVRSWQAACEGLLPATYLDSLRPADSFAGWAAQIGRARHDEIVLVYELTGRIVGFIALVADPFRYVPGGEIQSLYVLPEVWRKGIGHALHDAGLDFLRAVPFSEGCLWVLESNERARRFYAAHGWQQVPDSTRGHRFTGVWAEWVEYERKL